MKQQLQQYQTRVNQALSQLITKQHQDIENSAQKTFFEALEYATLNQGKRLRPALLYAVADALSIPLNKVDSAACAIELIHSYSLVHDDLPAMDNDDLRRGKPTTHIKYNEATAILVGDAQQTLAFEILSQNNQIDANATIELIHLLSAASGAKGMIGGQVIDIASENKTIKLDELKQLHLLKTGALIQCAILMGAVTADNYAQLKPSLTKLGASIGLAFQVHDDILDIESDTKTLGKPQGSDLELNKSTYPKLLGFDNAKTYRDKLIKQAKTQLSELPIKSIFLEQLIDYIAQRSH